MGSQIRNTKQKRPHETLLLVIRNRKSKALNGTFAPPPPHPTPGCEDVGRHDETLVNKLRWGLELLTPVLLTMWKTVYRPESSTAKHPPIWIQLSIKGQSGENKHLYDFLL